jgi:hypothetical protein
MSQLNTKIRYQYRDGANYKTQGEWILRGMVSVNEAEVLMRYCHNDGEENRFIPESVGMASLLETPWDDEIDHPFHTIEKIEMTDEDAQDERSIKDLISEFKSKDWEAEAYKIQESMM